MNNLTKKDSGIVYLLALIAPQIIGGLVLAVFCMAFPSADAAKESIWYTYLSALIPQLCFALVYVLYTKTKKIGYKAIFNENQKPTTKNCLLVVLMSVILFCSFFYLIDLLENVFVLIGIDITKFGTPVLNNTPARLIVNIILMAILPAIFEELIYRGLIFSGLKQSGKWFAVLVSAAMFSLMHLSILQLVYPFVMGIIFALVFDKTNCIYYTMLMHFCNNFLVLIVDYFNGIYLFNLTYALSAINIILIVLAAIVGLFLIWLIIKALNKGNTNKIEQAENKTFSFELCISIVVAVVFWIIVFITSLKG